MTAPMRKKRPRKPGEKQTLSQAMSELERHGTAQNCKIYRRHGARDPMFGVSFGKLRDLRKRIGIDHALGKALFETGNMDAMTLGLMIMDPDDIASETELTTMLEGLDYYMLVDLLVSELVVFRPERNDLMARWASSDGEYVKRAGYTILNNLARLADGLDDADFTAWLERIAGEIHDAPNRARQMMNIAVLSIGIRPSLHAEALAVARRIGPIEIDHGETSCETYDVAAKLADEGYLAKARKSLKWAVTAPSR